MNKINWNHLLRHANIAHAFFSTSFIDVIQYIFFYLHLFKDVCFRVSKLLFSIFVPFHFDTIVRFSLMDEMVNGSH